MLSNSFRMPLQEIPLRLEKKPLPAQVSELIEEADRRLDDLFETNRNRRVPRFLPSDPILLYHVLKHLTDHDIPPGRVFLEWGSGFGVGACLASLLGYTSHGIEIEPDLVEAAQTLARDLNIEVENICTSYFPEGFSSYPGQGGAELMVPENESVWDDSPILIPPYEGMDYEVEEIDLFYIYPWPGEQELMHSLFDAVAAEGAILIAYYGDQDIAVYRKVLEEDL